ncbi:MAG TPA: M10 family metallopeptidase C-terminal domain-containing protein [Rhizomicrobium sp.]
MQTITFGDQTIGDTNPIYDLKDNSISFTGLIGVDPLNLGGGSALTGLVLDPISWTFSQPVSQVSFDADVLGLGGSTTVTYYDQNGNVLDSVTNSALGEQSFSYSNPDIARVEVQSNSLSGFTVDNVAFADTTPMFSSVTNPAHNPLIEGFKWGADTLTYSMPTADTEYTAGGYAAVTGFAAASGAETSEIQQLMANVSAVSGLATTQTTGAGADLRFAQATSVDDGSGAQTVTGSTVFGPGANASSASGGDTWIEAGTTPTNVELMRDVGQALGLQMESVTGAHDSIAYSVMSSDIYPGGSPSDPSTVDAPSTLMQDDIAALQAIYGANYAVNASDTTYTWNPTTGEEFINGVGQGAPADGKVLMTVWDGGGNDTFDFSAYTDKVHVNLKPGHWTTIGSSLVADLGDGHNAPGNIAMAQLYQGNTHSLIENAIGGAGNDFLEGNSASNTLTGGAGHDSLHGLAGSDTLNGGAGADYLVGGRGNDTYVYGAASDSTGANFDTIRTFSVLHDKFALSFQLVGIDHAAKGALDIGAFNSDLAAATGNLQAYHAELFHATSGSFAGETFLVIDANGQAGYQAGSDLVIRLDHVVHPHDISVGDFVTS